MTSERRAILVVSSDEDFAERVTSALFSRCTIVRGLPQLETLRGLIETTGVEAIIVDLDDVAWDGRNITELIVALKAEQPAMPIVVASYNISATSLIPAMRAGANDVIDKDFAADDLIAQMDWLLQSRPAKRGSHSARIVAVMAPRPGAGATSIAVAMAVELARRSGASERVLLLDLGYPPSESVDLLGIKASYFMTDALGDLGRLDQTLIEGAFAQVKSPRLFVLPLAVDDENAQVAAAGDLSQLVDVLRSYFTAIVIDVNRPLAPRVADRLFLDANASILVVDQSMTTVHAAATMLDRMRRAINKDPEFTLVVSRHVPRLRPTVEEVTSALRAKGRPLVVPEDRLYVDGQRNLGTALTADAGNPYARAVRAIVDSTIAGGGGTGAVPAGAASSVAANAARLASGGAGGILSRLGIGRAGSR
ncbi:CpaE family protein [Zavarzinia sp.]|uniref:AAA family ATPase n=1 Tax=Zavarzinia sp. TaxID=2027920 RepID=UPI003565944E